MRDEGCLIRLVLNAILIPVVCLSVIVLLGSALQSLADLFFPF